MGSVENYPKWKENIGDTPSFHWTMIMGGRVRSLDNGCFLKCWYLHSAPQVLIIFSKKNHGWVPPFLGNPYIIWLVWCPALCFFPQNIPQDLKTRKRSFKRKARSEKRAQAPGGPNPTSLISIQMHHARQAVFFWDNMAKVGAEFCASIILLEGMTIYETWNVWREGLFIIVHWRGEMFRCPQSGYTDWRSLPYLTIRYCSIHRFPHPVKCRRCPHRQLVMVITIKLFSCKVSRTTMPHFCWKSHFQTTSASVWNHHCPQWPQWPWQTWGVLLGLQSRRHMKMRPLGSSPRRTVLPKCLENFWPHICQVF